MRTLSAHVQQWKMRTRSVQVFILPACNHDVCGGGASAEAHEGGRTMPIDCECRNDIEIEFSM